MHRIVVTAGLLVFGVGGAACGDDSESGGDTTVAVADDDGGAATTAEGTGGGAATTAAGTQPAGADAGTIVIQGFTFPAETRVAPGATVTVENSDDASHTVTEPQGEFNIEVAGGETGEFTAPSEPGEYSYVCNFHPGMEGVLIVEG